jgi:hypothetical protein
LAPKLHLSSSPYRILINLLKKKNLQIREKENPVMRVMKVKTLKVADLVLLPPLNLLITRQPQIVPVEVLGHSVVMKAVAMLIAVPPQMLR